MRPLSAYFVFLLLRLGSSQNSDSQLYVEPDDLSLTLFENKNIRFYTAANLSSKVELTLRREDAFDATPNTFFIDAPSLEAKVVVTGIHISSFAALEVLECHLVNDPSTCPFTNVNRTVVSVHVVHSTGLSVAVIVVGWIYFVAWSISFYPQIFLNFKRNSVIGLNFDFLLLNVIGFSCYTLYNVLMYFDENVQNIYLSLHPHSVVPVLLNDVVFAAHALFACIITALQCFFYQRGSQRISYVCASIATVFISSGAVSFALTVTRVINALQFIMFLSYIKMAVTLCKYFPQAYFNFRRKSTVGWSIGNVLLDLLGGLMDICQMILQAANTDDWTAFYGNPVKFGLGLVSIVFDAVFIVQHYVLYRNTDVFHIGPYEDIEGESAGGSRNDADYTIEDGSVAPIVPDT